MDIEELARALKVEKLAMIGEKIEVHNLDTETAEEILEFLKSIAGKKSTGYVAFKDSSIVFKMDENRCLIAVTARDKTFGVLKRMREI
ncbi:MAG: hypothetical protein QFX40_07110 [Archaeoglobales archaeon]|nr:hypothetical protein [Archaeoglobales archaeon]